MGCALAERRIIAHLTGGAIRRSSAFRDMNFIRRLPSTVSMPYIR
jgi:hypothetical protein